MKHKKSLWRHLVWSFLIPLVVGQIPAAGVLAWELSSGRSEYSATEVAFILGLVGSMIWTVADWRINVLSDLLEMDADGFRRTAVQHIEEIAKATQRGIIQAGDVFRILRYDHTKGILLNTTAGDPERTPRNILLNNTTIQTILNKILTSTSDLAEGRRRLQDAGVECGRNFGVLVKQMKGTSGSDLESLLHEWFEYDSNAGFGKLELQGDNASGDIMIVLRHNFLLTGNEYLSPERNLCAFMVGYIRGVFSVLPDPVLRKRGLDPDNIVVEHPIERCICQLKHYDLGCTFIVRGRRQT